MEKGKIAKKKVRLKDHRKERKRNADAFKRVVDELA
jgi:hypothetical protein